MKCNLSLVIAATVLCLMQVAEPAHAESRDDVRVKTAYEKICETLDTKVCIRVIGADDKEPLIGAEVSTVNRSIDSGWDNCNSDKREHMNVCNVDGLTGAYYNIPTNTEFDITYIGYRGKRMSVKEFTTTEISGDTYLQTIELEPYDIDEERDIMIHIAGMGIHDTGKIKVKNSRTGKEITMSPLREKGGEYYHKVRVRLGDELVFKHRGRRTIRAKICDFPKEIAIAMERGKASDEQAIPIYLY